MPVRFLILIASLGLVFPPVQAAQVGTNPVTAHQDAGVQEFFEQLVRDPSLFPRHEDLSRITTGIGGARSQEIQSALPAIFLALGHENEKVRLYAAAALFAISLRPDSAQLLEEHVREIGRLFDSPDIRMQRTACSVLGQLRPAPPAGVLPMFLGYIRQTDAQARAQPAAIWFVIRYAPDDQSVISVVTQFLSRRLDRQTRIDTLNAVGTPQVRDVRFIEAIARSLSDPAEPVRKTTVQTLRRIGRHALGQAKPILQQLARSDSSVEVRAAAMDALNAIANAKPSRAPH